MSRARPNPSIERTSTGLARFTSIVYVSVARAKPVGRPAHVQTLASHASSVPTQRSATVHGVAQACVPQDAERRRRGRSAASQTVGRLP